jgi:hypothetical protein
LYTKDNDGDGYILSSWGFKAEKTIVRPGHLFLSFSNLFTDEDSLFESKFGDQFPIKRRISDFLECVVSQIKKDISRKYPHYPDQNACYCIAIPPTWDDNARDILREAAVQAGNVLKFTSICRTHLSLQI